MKFIHISKARTLLDMRRPVDLSVWKADGSIVELKNCVSLRYSFYGGWRNIKILSSGQIRRVRDVCIFRINGMEVFI